MGVGLVKMVGNGVTGRRNITCKDPKRRENLKMPGSHLKSLSKGRMWSDFLKLEEAWFWLTHSREHIERNKMKTERPVWALVWYIRQTELDPEGWHLRRKETKEINRWILNIFSRWNEWLGVEELGGRGVKDSSHVSSWAIQGMELYAKNREWEGLGTRKNWQVPFCAVSSVCKQLYISSE